MSFVVHGACQEVFVYEVIQGIVIILLGLTTALNKFPCLRVISILLDVILVSFIVIGIKILCCIGVFINLSEAFDTFDAFTTTSIINLNLSDFLHRHRFYTNR